MKEHITAYEIANEIRLVRDQYPGAFLIVEGKVADLRMYRRFANARFCQVIPAHSKDNVIGAIEILDKDGIVGVLAIVDADFWRLDGKEPQSPNIFITDTHDLETMILASPALEKLVNEYCSSSKVERLTQQRKKSIRQILLESGRPIGYLRWISQVQNLSLVFEDLKFSRFIDRGTLATDIPKMIKVVKNKSERHDLDEADLQDTIEDVAGHNHNAWDVCCGHDLICILSIGLCSALGSNQSNDVKPEKIEKVLRIAYEFTYFRNTQLYLDIKGWETLNQAFQVFSIPEKPQVTQAAVS
jgi:hypothetical protein